MCSSDLIEDPLDWRWSTLLDSIGAVPNPWVSAELLAREMGWSRAGFEPKWLDYVYRDETVRVAPIRWTSETRTQSPVARHALPAIQDAFARGYRIAPERLEKKSMIRTRLLFTATAMNWDVPGQISVFTGIDRKSTRLNSSH